MSLEKVISFDDEIRNQRASLPDITEKSEAERLYEEELKTLIRIGRISVSDHVSSIMDK